MIPKFSIFFVILLIVCFVAGCASSNNPTGDIQNLNSDNDPIHQSDYILQTGDQLSIKFYYNPELNEEVIIRPDGKISLQLIDEVLAKGLSPQQLNNLLTQNYAKELKNPSITVILKSFSGNQIFVGGEVYNQGLISLKDQMTPLQAIFNAGGFKESAMPERTIIIRKGPDNRPVTFQLNTAKILKGTSTQPNFSLQPCDIVFVPKTGIALANKFVDQYIENLLLFRGISFGFSYRINDDDNNDD